MGVEKTRFLMVKKRHAKTFKEAVGQGKADEKMIPLCEFIAGTKGFFTSSCCAGRIMLICLPRGESKKDAYFHRRWHRAVSFREVMDALQEETMGEVWLKMEPFILHMGAEGLEGAKKILRIMAEAGIKRGGIIVAKRGKFLVELQGTQEMALPVKKGGKIIVENGFLKFVVETANKKMKKNDENLRKFEKICRKQLK